MKAYVIHLPRHHEREEYMRRQMEPAGLAWEFWPATDAQDFRRADFQGWFAGRHTDWLVRAAPNLPSVREPMDGR